MECNTLSEGSCEGEAIVVKELEKVPDLKGKIVVLKLASTDIADRIIDAKGIISEVGGFLCHLAIVAREFSIPFVILEEATTKIKEGNKIRIDATSQKGEVTIYGN